LIEGAYLDDLFFCPHHPDKGFRGEVEALKKKCECRKPSPGLILQASEKYNIDLSQSFFIGDRMCDLLAAKTAGLNAILVHRNGGKFLQKEDIDISYASNIFENLSIACENIRNK